MSRTVSAVTHGDGYSNDVDIAFGSMGEQESDAVDISGGTIDGANVRVKPIATGITAAGTTTADATAIAQGVNVVGTTASGTGVRLPTMAAGDVIRVFNQGANALLVYPPTGGTINALSANAGFSVGAGKAAMFTAATASAIYSQLGA